MWRWCMDLAWFDQVVLAILALVMLRIATLVLADAVIVRWTRCVACHRRALRRADAPTCAATSHVCGASLVYIEQFRCTYCNAAYERRGTAGAMTLQRQWNLPIARTVRR